eukprot:gene25787-biopygen24016
METEPTAGAALLLTIQALPTGSAGGRNDAARVRPAHRPRPPLCKGVCSDPRLLSGGGGGRETNGGGLTDPFRTSPPSSVSRQDKH